MRILLLCLLIVGAGLNPPLYGRPCPQEGTAGYEEQLKELERLISVSVKLVPVGVTVLDKNGKPVTGLKKEDFTLLDNGIPRPVEHFSIQNLTGPAAGDAMPAPIASTVSDFTVPDRRIFLIVMAVGHLEDPFNSLQALAGFTRNQLNPGDLIALMAYNRATAFTTEHDKIALLLEKFRDTHLNGGLGVWTKSLQLNLSRFNLGDPYPPDIQTKINELFASVPVDDRLLAPGQNRQLGYRGTILAGLTGDASRREVAQQLLEAPVPPAVKQVLGTYAGMMMRPGADVIGIIDMPLNDYIYRSSMTGIDMLNLFTAIEYLRYFSGEKHVLFVSDQGLFVNQAARDVRQLIELANDGQVSIHNLQTGGMPGNVHSITGTLALDDLRTIARLTGGTAALHSSIPKALRRVDEMSRSRYLLGFRPPGDGWDDQYHTIEVKTSRPGAEVFSRRGFVASKVLQRANRADYLRKVRLLSAARYNSSIDDLPFRIKTGLTKDRDGRRVTSVSLEIDPAAFDFQLEKGTYRGRLDALVTCLNPEKAQQGEVWPVFDVTLTPAEYQELQLGQFTYQTTVPFYGQGTWVKVVIYNLQRDKTGSRTNRVW